MSGTDVSRFSPTLVLRRARVLLTAWHVQRSYRRTEARAQKERDEQKRSELWNKTHVVMARLVCKEMSQLQGLWVKLGQFLSTRVDLVPVAWASELRQLQEAAPPSSVADVRSVLQAELGLRFNNGAMGCYQPRRGNSGSSSSSSSGDDCSTLPAPFASFDWQPVASASIAQVHRATLVDGRKVAVKVQHRHAARLIELDIELLRELLNFLRLDRRQQIQQRQQPQQEQQQQLQQPQKNAGLDIQAVLEEWCTETRGELDFLREAVSAERVAESLARDSRISTRVPGVLRRPPELAPTRRVIVSDFVDGVKATDAVRVLGTDPQRLLHEVSAAFARQIFVDGFFHADPHPGNIIVERNTHRPFLLDFGLTREVPQSTRLNLARLVAAAAIGDGRGVAAALRELGMPLVSTSGAEGGGSPATKLAQVLLQDASLSQAQSVSAAAPAVLNHSASALRHPGAEQTSKHHTAVPQDGLLATCRQQTPASLVFMLRVISCIKGLAASLGVEHSTVESMYPAALSVLQSDMRERWSLGKQLVFSATGMPLEQRLADALTELLVEGNAVGVAVAVYLKGTLVANCAAGDMSPASAASLTSDSLFNTFGCGNALSALSVHCLLDSGALSLNETVAKYWNQFGCHNKEDVTVRDLLEHRSGVSAFVGRSRVWDGSAPLSELTSWDLMTSRLASMKPTEKPKDGQPACHALSFGWLCGGLTDRVAHTSYPALLQKQIVDPLCLTGHILPMVPPNFKAQDCLVACGTDGSLGQMPFRAPELHSGDALVSNISEMVGAVGRQRNLKRARALMTNPLVINDSAVHRSLIPSFNTRASAVGLATVFAALAGDGAVAGRGRVLSEKHCRWLQEQMRASGESVRWPVSTSVEATTASHASACGEVRVSGQTWPLGFRHIQFQRRDGSMRTGAFGYGGAAGCLAFCDPETGIAVAVLANELSVKPKAVRALLRVLEETIPELGRCVTEGLEADWTCRFIESPEC